MILSLLTLTAGGQTIRYVKPSGTGDGSSWANASGDLQAMINASQSGYQVWVAAGTYKPTSTTARDISFVMKDGVGIYGGFVGNEAAMTDRPPINPVAGQPSSTTLSGDIDNDGMQSGNSYHVISNNNNGLTSNAVLDGFVITGATGGAIYNNGGRPTLTNCSFINNTASNYGGAIYNENNSRPTFNNCNFQNNTAANKGGAIYNLSSSPSLTNCSFLNNKTSNYGGAIYYYNSSPSLTNCSFLNNTSNNGGAIYYSISIPSLTNCSFIGNSATNEGGAIDYQSTTATLVNCAFLANQCSNGPGGAIYSYETSLSVTNSSFQNNTSTLGGAIYTFNGVVTLTNSVAFGNGGSNAFGNLVNNSQPSGITATYSLLEASALTSAVDVSGPGNLTTTTSPFTSTATVALNACSPAINAGSNAAYYAANGPANDLAANSRFFPTGGTIDMGAIEFQGSPGLTQPTTYPQTNNNALAFDGTNDFVSISLTNRLNCSPQSLSLTNALTIEYWFKGTNLQSAVRYQLDGSTYIVAGWGNTPGQQLHILSNDGGLNGIAVGAAATDGNWHHVAMSWQQGGTFASYLDGQLVDSRAASNTPLPSIGTLTLGAWAGQNEFTNGTLDEVRVWNVARTQAQIQQGMRCSVPLSTSGLVIYYPFDQAIAGGSNTDQTLLYNQLNPDQFVGSLQNFGLTGNSSNWVEGAPATPPTRLYVKANASGANTGADWTNAFTDLQSALSYPCSQSLTEIWVAAGTYKPTSTTARTISFTMKNGVAIYGGFAGNETNLADRPPIDPVSGNPSSSTLSGDIGTLGNASDNAYHVLFNPQGLNTTAVLDGFVITGGNANGSGSNINGGGVFNNASGSGTTCSPTFRNCSFQSNSASLNGGAIFNYGTLGISSPVLVNCAFVNNTSNSSTNGYGGAIFNYGNNGGTSSPTLTNCWFVGNSAFSEGGAIYNYGSGSGSTSSPILTNCAFVSNWAKVGGAMVNHMENGGTSSPVLTNCSLQSNSAVVGWAIHNIGSNLTLTNSVLFNNGRVNTFSYSNGASITATYSLLDASALTASLDVSGPGNLTTTSSPFTSTATVALNACSSAINAGNPASTTATSGPYSATNLPATDLLGNPRIGNGRVDMGAAEFQGTPVSLQAAASLPQANLGVVVSLTATGASTYQWTAPPTAPLTSPATGSAVSVSLTTAGVQTFTVVGSSGQCSLTTLVSVTALAGPDLSAIISLPDANFPAGSSKNLLMQLQEVNGSPATGNITITITVPTGYSVSFDNTLTSFTVSGGGAGSVDNTKWHQSNNVASQQVSITINGGQSVGAKTTMNLGFTVRRTSANAGSVSNITVNIADDSSGSYDVNRLNNVYARIISGL
ncbi:LamG domain-containing protein [Spirosoma panaciterrae]|uniref:LamG domain-containing protein n=1 Tax=Spirosoma panaciterrae TaxID=496058 RepID=UPI0003602AFB|nr:LamG domain-containing protein [Spirosoma panaciterrae]